MNYAINNKSYVWGEDLSGSLQGAGGVGGLLLGRSNDDYLPVYDGNGNIIAYKNSTGDTVATYTYDPFGNTIAHTGLDFSYKFSTKPQDELSGLYYYGYRFYHSMLGRWINRDPIGENGGLHLYGFIGNNAFNLIDIFGLNEQSSVFNFENGNFRFHMYGNWGGPGWANGRWVNDFWFSEDLFLIDPKDKLDACYKEHDLCYEKCRRENKCPAERHICFANCDHDAVNCQLSVFLAPQTIDADWSILGLISAPIGMTVLKLQQIKNTFIATVVSIAKDI